jgi:hypothetical protein
VPRTLLCCAALAAFALPGRAEQQTAHPETLIQLTVQPMPAPKPALRYLLLPELMEMHPGNPVQGYLKCYTEQQQFFFDKDTFRRREEYQAMPLRELPAKDLLDYGHSALRQADRAARLDKPDWQILPKLKTDGVWLLLPEVQQMRTLAAALKVRFRAEVALGHFDDAIRTAKTVFALARHLGEHPTLIGDLVGIAIAFVAIDPLEEMLEQPGCPNFYWALTNLPSPFISLEKGMEGERALIRGEFRDLDESAPMTAEQIKKLMEHIDKLREVAQAEVKAKEPDRSTRTWVAERTRDEKLLGAARRRLVEYGLPEERLARFPAEQVIILDEWREFEERRDEVMKLMTLPAWQAEEALPDWVLKHKPRADEWLFLELVPAIYRVRRAQARLEQRIGLLRCVEALRLYAAAHDGRLPARLADAGVRLPDDPFTGKPFDYQVDGATAHLRGSPPPGLEKEPSYNVHYAVTIRK